MESIELIAVSGADALAERRRLRSRFESTGLYPVLLGDESDRRRLEESIVVPGSLREILDEAATVVFPDWFLERLNDDLEPKPGEIETWVEDAGDEMGVVTHLNVDSGLPKNQVLIGLVPLDDPADLFAAIRWGGWNDCPWPAEHVAVHRHWAQRFGSEVIAITGDVVECEVERPPIERRDALRLAKEQIAYCESIIENGTLTLPSLAAGLVESRYWYFWWD